MRLRRTSASFVARWKRDEGVRMCLAIKQNRVSAHEEILEQQVEVLGPDAAVLITGGVYTVQLRDGRGRSRDGTRPPAQSTTASDDVAALRDAARGARVAPCAPVFRFSSTGRVSGDDSSARRAD